MNGRMKVMCPMKNEKSGKTYWLRLGSAFTNADGSMNVYLDALPVNRKLQLRELDERDLRPNNGEDAPLPAAAGAAPPQLESDNLPF